LGLKGGRGRCPEISRERMFFSLSLSFPFLRGVSYPFPSLDEERGRKKHYFVCKIIDSVGDFLYNKKAKRRYHDG